MRAGPPENVGIGHRARRLAVALGTLLACACPEPVPPPPPSPGVARADDPARGGERPTREAGAGAPPAEPAPARPSPPSALGAPAHAALHRACEHEEGQVCVERGLQPPPAPSGAEVR
jgi:hypothetical protein